MSSAQDLASSAQALAAAIYASAVDPADALRLLLSLAKFAPADATSTSPIGAAMAIMQAASGDLFRRAAVVALARASASYQPSSADDAAAVSSMVCTILDAEITLAGDQGADATFLALRTVRAAVSNDLAKRGAYLATVAMVRSPLPVPAPVLAQRMYRDPTRSDSLIQQADVKHPAFMPVAFRALSK